MSKQTALLMVRLIRILLNSDALDHEPVTREDLRQIWEDIENGMEKPE